MLRGVRARVVDVDTGAEPSALPPLLADEWTPAPDPPARIRRAVKPLADEDSPPRASVRRQPEVAPDGSAAGACDRLTAAADELLSLDDSASRPPSADPAPAWRRGLRG